VDVGPTEDYVLAAPVKPLLDAPHNTIEGAPGVTTAVPLSNRRQVLSRDSDGRVLLWDILNVRCPPHNFVADPY